MNNTRTFDDKPAARESVPLLLGLYGPSGGGKTFSALRLATGIQRVTGGEIYVIDTEAKRALNYAFDPATGRGFKFRHLAFGAPFGPLDYLAAIEHCVGKGAGVVVVDSLSHEHEGPGGVLEMHEAEVERMGGGDKNNFRAWAKPKAERRRFINTLLQMPANFVFCFRAKEKMKPIPGKQPMELGFMPIAGEEFIYEMTASCLLPPKADGVPCWQSEFPGEKMTMKLPEQFKPIFAAGGVPLSEDIGEKLALWAKGTPVAPPVSLEELEKKGFAESKKGTAALVAFWKTLTAAQQKSLTAIKDSDWKPNAAAADSEAAKPTA